MYKQLLWFVARFFACYLLLVAALAFGAGKPYSAAFQSVGTSVFGTMWENVQVKFKPSIALTGTVRFRDNDTQIQVTNQGLRLPSGAPPMGSVNTNSRLQGYLPMAMLVSLCFALPIGMKRKSLITLSGLFLLSLWITFLLGLVIVLYGELSGMGWFGFQPETKQMLQKTVETILMNQIGISYVVPSVVWCIIILISGDYRSVLDLMKTQTPAEEVTHST